VIFADKIIADTEQICTRFLCEIFASEPDVNLRRKEYSALGRVTCTKSAQRRHHAGVYFSASL